jgi:glycosyltransferase involved in cell wall biosynthesis
LFKENLYTITQNGKEKLVMEKVKSNFVSVIVPLFNGEKTVQKTLESILVQKVELEVIVVDDGSTDRSVEIIKKLAEKDERIKYFYQKNSGSPAKPRNKGLKEATGEFVGFCDQDDIYYPEKLEKQIKAYEECKDRDKIGIIISSADLIDESGRVVGQNIKSFEGFMDSKEAYELLLKGDFITACSALVPRKIFDEIGCLDESLKGVDDYDLWLRISQRYGILTIKEPLCAWRQSKESLSADKAKQYIETEKVFKKLEKEDKGERIRVGHSKNLMRIFIAKNLDKDFAYAEDLLSKLKKYPITKKGQIVISVFELSHSLSFWFLRFLQLIGQVSL